jgi:hypothetical protein
LAPPRAAAVCSLTHRAGVLCTRTRSQCCWGRPRSTWKLCASWSSACGKSGQAPPTTCYTECVCIGRRVPFVSFFVSFVATSAIGAMTRSAPAELLSLRRCALQGAGCGRCASLDQPRGSHRGCGAGWRGAGTRGSRAARFRRASPCWLPVQTEG